MSAGNMWIIVGSILIGMGVLLSVAAGVLLVRLRRQIGAGAATGEDGYNGL